MNIKTYKLKRLLDLSMVICGFLFPLLWPLWIVVIFIIPLLIWLEDRGPIFYSQNRIGKNKKYFISAKDLALADTLIADGFSLPSSFKYNELSQQIDVPSNLLQLAENNQKAFLALKIVEIIGEDEPYQLDPETIYFVTNLLNKTDLVTIRNKVLNSALPKRI